MASISGISGNRPLLNLTQNSQAAATRPGRDPSGKPLADGDVYEPKRTEAGEKINTADGISEAEAMALVELATEDAAKFMQQLDADSANGTPINFRIEKPFEGVGTAYADFTARDGNVLIECGISVSSETVKEALKEYLAPADKQNGEPVIGKLTVTGKVNEAGEITNVKAEASVGNLPKFSMDKMGEFEKTVASILEQLPTGQTITDDMKKEIGERMQSALKRSSSFGLELIKELIESGRVFKVDISSENSKSHAHLKGGKNALDIRIDHALDEASKGYPRVDGQTKLGLDAEDKDTLDLGKPRIFTTENLLVSFEGNKPALFRVEKDGSRTPLNDVFGQIIFGLPYLMAMLSKKSVF